MPRHESVTDSFVDDLKAEWRREAERVKTAPSWPETQKAMFAGTYAFQVALGRVDEGWSREEIKSELGIRTIFGALPNPINVIGNRRVDEEDTSS